MLSCSPRLLFSCSYFASLGMSLPAVPPMMLVDSSAVRGRRGRWCIFGVNVVVLDLLYVQIEAYRQAAPASVHSNSCLTSRSILACACS